MIKFLNDYGRNSKPCIFIISYDKTDIRIFAPEDCRVNNIFYNINGFNNTLTGDYKPDSRIINKDYMFKRQFITYDEYLKGFNIVRSNFIGGNSFLTNLTYPTKIKTDLTLRDFFYNSKARYRFLYKDCFTVFSPESFVKIKSDTIYSTPMKGTISRTHKTAKKTLLADPKEFAEHITIVDLIRNDLSIVAKKVRVKRFRYLTEVENNSGGLLQMSSEITGKLTKGWQASMGDIIEALLPAGSITGAPKKKTVDIIKEAEGYERGFYTGIVGYFDGKNLDTGVMIRFVENTGNGLIYKSGGGITIYSNPANEYNELKEKVYVPF